MQDTHNNLVKIVIKLQRHRCNYAREHNKLQIIFHKNNTNNKKTL